MVAMSLYRGNLHRVPVDVPRRWLMPNHTITLKDFKSLTRKREKALSRLLSNPNPNPNSVQEHEFVGDNQTTDDDKIKIEDQTVGDDDKHQRQSGSDGEQDRKGIGDYFPSPPPDTKSVPVPEIDCNENNNKNDQEKPPAVEINAVDLLSDEDRKKMDIEQNLKVLNERKHKLVQMLKQILNAEEELKSRNSLQTLLVRPPVPQQVEATTDSGSNSRQIVNGVGAEANYCGDLEGESDGGPNHSAHARQSHQMHSTSPSTSSPLRRLSHTPTQHTMVPHTNRPSLGVGSHTPATSSPVAGVASSPSRFAPPGHPTILSPLSVSGTHFSASSPSPAASGGTSVFRESRITSPSWN